MPSAWPAIIISALATTAFAVDPAAGDFSKPPGNSVRVMTWNNEKRFIADATKDAIFKRVIETVNPDVIAFQEVDDALGTSTTIGTAIKNRLQSYVQGYTWYIQVGSTDSFNRNALCSRYPMILTRQDTTPASPSNTRGVTMGLIDLPNASFASDFYVMAVHMKSGGTTGIGGDYERRQVHADAVINWMRDARTAGGNITLAANTPMLLLGDTNMGFSDNGDEIPWHPARTLLDGFIYDTATYGAASAPDWDGTFTTDASPYDWNNAEPRTHPSSGPVSRIDRFYFTDSVLRVVDRFVVNTQTMTTAALMASGLTVTDTVNASDHLPGVVDFALGAEAAAGKLLINEFSFNDNSTDDRTFFEIKNVGAQEINLDGPTDYRLKQSNSGMPTSAPGTENEGSDFDLKGLVPPGGLFVLYAGSGDSAGIKTMIETNLPNKLQRQDMGSSFFLTNANDTAFALVQQGKADISTTSESLVEAYGWASSAPATTHYFRTNSGNALTIPLGASQLTATGVGGAASDNSVSRNPGNIVTNNYTNWTLLATATPGLANSSPSCVTEWSLY